MEQKFSPVSRFFLMLAAFVIVVAGMRVAGSLLVPFFLAIFIAVLCSPPLNWLRSRKVPNWLAITLIVLMIVAVGMVLGTIFGGSLRNFVADLPNYANRLQVMLEELIVWLQAHGIEVDSSQWQSWLSSGAMLGYARNLAGSIGGIAANAFLIILTVVFILAEEATMQQKLDRALDDSDKQVLAIFRVTHSINQYMAIKLVISLITGVLAWLVCLVAGLEYAVLWGSLAFLLNFVPTLGSLIAAVPPVLLALVDVSPFTALMVAAGYLSINMLMGNILEPRIMGRGLGLSPLVVLMSLVFWGWVLGPIGMLLSVPLTMMVKIALEAFPETRWVGVVLGNLASLPDSKEETNEQPSLPDSQG